MNEQGSPTPPLPDLYVNAAQIAVSVYDVTLTFGTAIPDASNETEPRRLPLEERVRLRMSPQHALVLCGMLMRNLAIYEQQVGPIAVSPELIERLGIGAELRRLRGSCAESSAAAKAASGGSCEEEQRC